MRSTIALLASCLVFLLAASTPMPATAQDSRRKPSFDCSKARAADEKLICSQEELADFDTVLASAYNWLRSQLDGPGKVLLRDNQRQWIKDRNRECRVEKAEETLAGVVGCMEDAFKARFSALMKNLEWKESAGIPDAERVPPETLMGTWKRVAVGLNPGYGSHGDWHDRVDSVGKEMTLSVKECPLASARQMLPALFFDSRLADDDKAPERRRPVLVCGEGYDQEFLLIGPNLLIDRLDSFYSRPFPQPISANIVALWFPVKAPAPLQTVQPAAKSTETPIAAAAAPPADPFGPNCATPANATEQLVCGNAALQALFSEVEEMHSEMLAGAYERDTKGVGTAEKVNVAHKAWLRKRDQKCGTDVTTTVSPQNRGQTEKCLVIAYQQRLKELEPQRAQLPTKLADAFWNAGSDVSVWKRLLPALQRAVQANDAAAVAKFVEFPLTVNDEKVGDIFFPDIFIKRYREVFTDRVRNAILDQSLYSLPLGSKGLMFGNGEAWARGSKIFAINP